MIAESELIEACKRILSVAGSENLSGKEFRIKIANELDVDEERLATTEMQERIDEIIFEHLTSLNNAQPEDNLIAKNSLKRKGNFKKEKMLKVHKTKSKETSTSRSKEPSKNTSAIDRLKGYIVKCGVRKVWKKELEGMNDKKQIAKLQEILTELGMEGRPTIQKCKELKERREFQKELSTIDQSNMSLSRLRSQAKSTNDDTSPVQSRPRMDLSMFGDSEE